MTDDFTTLNEAELDYVSGGIHLGSGPPGPPATGDRHGWYVPPPPISATSVFNNPDLYRRGTSTAKAF